MAAPPMSLESAGGSFSLKDATEINASGEAKLDSPVPPHSAAWARVVKPFTWFLFILLATVMVLPFAIILLLPAAQGGDKASQSIEWAHTILPPVVGFAGAVVGYYFGTRSSDRTDGTPAPDGG